MRYYLVLCLHTSIDVGHDEAKATVPFKDAGVGVEGFVPVFSDKEKAEEFALNKYKVIPIVVEEAPT